MITNSEIDIIATKVAEKLNGKTERTEDKTLSSNIIKGLRAFVLGFGVFSISLHVYLVTFLAQYSRLSGMMLRLWLFFFVLWLIDEATEEIHIPTMLTNSNVFAALLIATAIIVYSAAIG